MKAGAVVIDNSSAFRMDPNVPLVIPEINGDRIRGAQGHHRRSELLGDHGAGAAVADPPAEPHQARDHVDLSGRQRRRRGGDGGTGGIDARQPCRRGYPPKVLPHPYAFNLFNHNTAIDPETGYNEEETKVIKETRKIFEDERIAVGVTCVRVPVLRAHCEAITFECERPITEDEVRAILSRCAGREDRRRSGQELFPDADRCLGPGRRSGRPHPQGSQRPSGHSISMFVAADQLLKGAALNAIQIAELLPERAMA